MALRHAATAAKGRASQPSSPFSGAQFAMTATRTFSIIKPDATRRNLTGAVTKMLEEAGLRVVASKRIQMTREQAEGFYAVHKERPFFNDLVSFMISGPVVVQVLEGEDAVKRNRDVMGATNPADAAEGTWPNPSRPTRSTVRTATRMQRSRSPISSSRKKS
jgi:nucleoside-diphosphate kinase